MTKKKKGSDADGDDDREQSRTPIRSELDKLEGRFRVLFTVYVSALTQIFTLSFVILLCRKRTDSSPGSFEPAHQAAPEVQH